MDLISVHPVFNLYNSQWPIYTNDSGTLPPAPVFLASVPRDPQPAPVVEAKATPEQK